MSASEIGRPFLTFAAATCATARGAVNSANAIMIRTLRYLLNRPATRRVKEAIKDAWWSIKGWWIENPPLPHKSETLLFVCLGNICRSPFAARLAERRLAAAVNRGGVRCDSAGLRVAQSARPPQAAVEAATRFNVSIRDHVPVQLTPDMMNSYDVIVVMDAFQFSTLRAMYPSAVQRIVLLPLITDSRMGFARYNIVDPFGRERSTFDACYQTIDENVSSLLSRLGVQTAGEALA